MSIQMAIGELGLPTELAVSLVVEGLKLTPEFATTLHQQMVEHHVLVLLQQVFHATLLYASLVSKHKYRKIL
jgi:hypothetical protein